MSSIASKFFAVVILTQALGGCSTYVSQLEGQAFEPVDPAVNLASEQPAKTCINRAVSKNFDMNDAMITCLYPSRPLHILR